MPSPADLRDRTLFVTGASRGIGEAIAVRAAADGANVVIAAKTESPHPKLPGTIHTAAEAVEAAGGRALAVPVDVRDEEAVERAVERTMATFGGIDALVANAGAIHLAGTLETPVKRYDLMQDVNVRGAWVCARACLPHLMRAENPHVLMMAPPISLEPRWLAPHLAYTISKYGMSLSVIGLAAEFREAGVGVNALWPRTVIATSAVRLLEGVEPEECRTPAIVADAAHAILVRDAATCTGNFFSDEEVLAEAGVTDLTPYAVEPGSRLRPDLYVE
ncbi:MAG: NAD(P)-dependent oxidoreductase [Gemmatimonadota bacterium]|nr:NAD(P)-dependent oxidoreductase [Gemmatimonadota bacterium]